MTNLSHDQHRKSEAEQHEASTLTLAVVMAGIFAFFVAGIASAFIYAKDTTNSAQQSAEVPLPPPAAHEKAAPETTGSGAVK